MFLSEWALCKHYPLLIILHSISIQPACQDHRHVSHRFPLCDAVWRWTNSKSGGLYTQLAFGFVHVCVIMHTLPFSVICLCALNLFLEGRRVQASLFSRILSQGQNTTTLHYTTCYPPLPPSILDNASDISTFTMFFHEGHSCEMKGALFNVTIFLIISDHILEMIPREKYNFFRYRQSLPLNTRAI